MSSIYKGHNGGHAVLDKREMERALKRISDGREVKYHAFDETESM